MTETVFLNANTVNKPSERTGPGDFELLKTLGKGGYGKVRRSCSDIMHRALL